MATTLQEFHVSMLTNYHKPSDLKTTEIYSLTVLKTRIPELRFQQGQNSLSEVKEENLLQDSQCLLVAASTSTFLCISFLILLLPLSSATRMFYIQCSLLSRTIILSFVIIFANTLFSRLCHMHSFGPPL